MTTPATSSRLNEVRSPKERRPDESEPVLLDVRASTKSAPHRSGDPRPRRGCGPPRGLNEVRSPQERRPRPRAASRCRRCRLNEVRSPQERRPGRGNAWGRACGPQRSPLPTGAETCARGLEVLAAVVASTKSAPHRSGDSSIRDIRYPSDYGLNEVRSPQERRRPRRSAAGRCRRGLNEVRSPQEQRPPDTQSRQP